MYVRSAYNLVQQLITAALLCLLFSCHRSGSSGLKVVQPSELNEVPNQHHVKQLFQDHWDNLYQQGFCHRNIRNFMNLLEKENLDLTDARALIIYKKNDESFVPLNTRLSVLKPWYFHVVMELDGEIYDFDFMQTPTVLPAKEYFKKIFVITSPKSKFVFKRLTLEQFRTLPNSFFMEYSRFTDSTLDLEWFDLQPVSGPQPMPVFPNK